MPEKYFDLPAIAGPEPDDREGQILEWCEDKFKEGIRFIESQIGYDRISQALDEVFSLEKSTTTSYVPNNERKLSKTRANLIAKTAEDLTAQLTDTRMFWNYTTYNKKYDKQYENANKSAKQWFEDNLIALRIGDVIRDYTIAGTGIAHLYYSKEMDDMMLEAEDPRGVFPIEPLSYHSFRNCRGAIVRRCRTVNWVKEEYNKTVVSDSTGGYGGIFGWLRRVIDGPGERGGPLSKRAKSDYNSTGVPPVFVNTMYLKDKRTNKTNKILRMGPWDNGNPDSPWSYEVRPDEPIFPFGRMIVWCTNRILYDNTSPYWSGLKGRIPLIKFTLNPWPRTWFGKAPLWDCIPLNQSINSNLRVIDDHCAQVAQPALIGDRNVSKAEMNKANTRSAGMKIRTNMASGKGLQIVNPPPLDAVIWEVIKWCQDLMQKISGTADPSIMATLGQIPSDDTIDTIMKAMTPQVRLRSRILEGAYTELAEHYLYSLFEFDTLTKRIERLGPESATPEDFDFDPHTSIPDNVPDGDPNDIAATAANLGSENPLPLYRRAHALLQTGSCKFDPSSLLNSAAQQDIMKDFLLAKMGYMSVFTLMEKMGITNFAPPTLTVPPDEIGRLQLQQTLGIGMIANAQGRKATDAAPPAMGNTGNGPTITTS